MLKWRLLFDSMKNLTFRAPWLLAVGALAVLIPFADAQEQATQPAVTTNVQVTAPPKLPYGVDDVLKLSQAKISDDIIINYIHNSGTVYNLQPNDIVYLRNRGVSDQVLNVMVNQRTQVAVAAQAEAAQAAAAAQNQAQPAPAPIYAPAPGYDQSAPAEAPTPASTVYVIPNSATYTGYTPYYSYPYPYYYGGYYGPVVSFGYGYCSPSYYHGGYHGYYYRGSYGGGWHGGYHGGGWHGGSTWHGGGIHVSSGGTHIASTGFHGGGAARGGGTGGFHGAAHR